MKATVNISKKDRLTNLIERARSFTFCGPSDDSDEQPAVTTGYRYVLVQIKRLASPLLAEAEAARLNAIDVEVDNIYTAYDARAELDALMPDIEAALARADENALDVGGSACIIDPGVIEQLSKAQSQKLDVVFLVQMCREINSCFAHGNLVATLLLMRTILNYVPPLFERRSFEQVVAQSDRSLKENFRQLEDGLRKVADFHAHRRRGRPISTRPRHRCSRTSRSLSCCCRRSWLVCRPDSRSTQWGALRAAAAAALLYRLIWS